MPRILRITPELEAKLKAEFPIYEFELFGQKFRLRKGKAGYCSEREVKGWFYNRWIPVVTYSGSDRNYYFKTLEICNDEFINKIREDVKFNGTWL